MKKLALPLVMMASLVTLVSCGQKSVDTSTTLSPTGNSTVTGVVVTPKDDLDPTMVDAEPNETTPATPVVLTRRETVSYNTPEGMIPVEFDVTVTDGVITKASAKTLATTVASKNFEDKFAAEVSAQVVGKKAATLKLDAVGGASLTSAAFEQFVHSF